MDSLSDGGHIGPFLLLVAPHKILPLMAQIHQKIQKGHFDIIDHSHQTRHFILFLHNSSPRPLGITCKPTGEILQAPYLKLVFSSLGKLLSLYPVPANASILLTPEYMDNLLSSVLAD